MPKLGYVLLVLLLSLHACSARHLNSKNINIGGKSHVINKHVYSTISRSSSILTQLTPVGAQTNINRADELSNTVLRMNSETVILKKGSEFETSFSEETTERERWQARSMLESSVHAKETVNSKEDDIIDDVVVTDYAKPHRKPPIHNRKL